MQPDNAPVAEPAAVVTPEPSAAPQAPGSVPTEPAKVEPAKPEVEETISKKEYDKLVQENNLHKNKLTKIEEAQETARKAELSEVDRLKEELAQRDTREAQREAQAFRDTTIDQYLKDSPAALKAAKSLIAKNPANLVWGEGLTEAEARADLEGQLDALKEIVGGETPAIPEASTRSNNPIVRNTPDPDRAALIVEARKTGDWSKVIGDIPSVAAQSKSFE